LIRKLSGGILQDNKRKLMRKKLLSRLEGPLLSSHGAKRTGEESK